MKDYTKIYETNKSLFVKVYSYIDTNDLSQLKSVFSSHLDLIDVPEYGITILGNSLLHLAAKKGHNEICTYLIDSGIDVNISYDKYSTALGDAAKAGMIETVKLLIERGAWIDGVSCSSETPLTSAAREGHFKVVEFLIECGADINRIQNSLNMTALDIAVSYESVNDNKKIIELLKSKSALSAHEPFDFTVERAAAVTATIHAEAGWVLSGKLSKNSIDVRVALLQEDKKNKIIFTTGAFQQLPKTEVMLCVPVKWPFNKQLMDENTHAAFPIQFLFAVAEHRLGGGKLEEGCIFEKQDVKWEHLAWPEKIDAFIAVDYQFGSDSEPCESYEDSEEVEIISLLMLVPIKYPKAGCPKSKKLDAWIEKHKTAKWAKTALKYDDFNDDK